MVIELKHTDTEAYIEDVFACRQQLAAIRDLVKQIDTALCNISYTAHTIKEQQGRINILENRLVTIRSSINLTNYRKEDALERRKNIKRFDFKAKKKSKYELAQIDETLEDLRTCQERTRAEIDSLTQEILNNTAKKRHESLRRNMFLTIRELSVAVSEYRHFRADFFNEYQIKLPEVNLCDIISTTPEGNIQVYPKEIPFVSTLYKPQPHLHVTEEIDGVQYEVECL